MIINMNGNFTEIHCEEQLFENLKLEKEIIKDCKFSDCEFVNCTFDGCTLQGTVLLGCRFKKCSIINLAVSSSHMSHGEFFSCSFVGINWGDLMPTGKFARPISSFQDCRFKFNTFNGIPLMKFDFSNSVIVDTMFADCTMAESNFSGCDLERTEFFQCDLKKANFRNARGYQIDITSCKVKGAAFSFPEAINLLNVLGVKID